MSLIKSSSDIALLREGGRRLAQVLQKVVSAARPGISTFTLDQLAHRLIIEAGDAPSFLNYTPTGAKTPYPFSLCTSVNDEVVHGLPSARELKVGDVIGLDLGLCHKNLFTDLAVTVIVGGETGGESQRLVAGTREALRLAIAAARSGATLGDVGHAVETFAKRNKLGLVRDLAGHFVGHKVHEEPLVPNFGRAGQGLSLRPGMVLALEPMLTLGGDKVIYLPDNYTVKTADGSLAAHFEHTILITNKGAEILTQV